MELWMNPMVAGNIVSGGSVEDLVDALDIDGIAYYTISMEKHEVLDGSKGIIRDKWGVIRRHTGQTTSHPIEAPIKSERDLAAYVPPDPDEPSYYMGLDSMVKRFKGRRAIVAIIEQPFQRVNELRGAADHYMDMIRNPDLILGINEIVTKHHLRFVKNYIERGADVICFSGDFATQQGPMVSPQHLEKFGIPPLAALVQFVHSRGVPCILHSDGNILPIMEMLLDTGPDALHPIDPEAGLDIGDFKEKYGRRVCLIGSIDCSLLILGTKQQVRHAVKENIRKAGKGGGLIAASSHSVQSATKPENYVEMVKAIREYGRYPLSSDLFSDS
jgi:uroporphyrinogen decarboxylase